MSRFAGSIFGLIIRLGGEGVENGAMFNGWELTGTVGNGREFYSVRLGFPRIHF